ncbi:MAG: hypothetical protein R6V53_05570 [Candidatus Woesearchaeota archaeon]
MIEKPNINYSNPKVFHDFLEEYTGMHKGQHLEKMEHLRKVPFDDPLFNSVDLYMDVSDGQGNDIHQVNLWAQVFTNFNSERFLQESRIEDKVNSYLVPNRDSIMWHEEKREYQGFIPSLIGIVQPVYNADNHGFGDLCESLKKHEESFSTVMDSVFDYFGIQPASNRSVEFDLARLDLKKYL